jgi:hypothetical protein
VVYPVGVVISGGNVAFDIAITARRLGGDTVIVCLECGAPRLPLRS